MLRRFDHSAALAHYDAAIERLEARFGGAHPSLAGLHCSAAAELCALGRHPEASARAQRALALWTFRDEEPALADEARVVLARARAGASAERPGDAEGELVPGVVAPRA